MADKEKVNMVEKHILIGEEDWRKLLIIADREGIPLFFAEDENLEMKLRNYLGHAERILESRGFSEILGIVDRQLQNQELEKTRKKLDDDDEEESIF